MSLGVFEKQNIFLKIFTIFVAIIVTTFVGEKCFYAMFLFSVLYFMIEPKIFVHWFNLILKLFPFFSSLILLSIIFRSDFFDQMILISRIIYILLLSVYLVKSSSMDKLFMISHNSKFKYSKIFVSYIVATISFIPYFLQNYKIAYQSEENVVEAFVKAVDKTSKSSKDIWFETCDMMNKERVIEEFWTAPNLLLMIFFAGEIIFLSVKF